MALGLDQLIGALPDAIAWAITQVLKAISGAVISQIIDYGFEPLLAVANPVESDAAVAAWDEMMTIAIALLPIAIAGGLIVWPFSEDRNNSLWQMVLRVVAVLFFIAVSKPLWGFLIDATNALTLAISPDTFRLTFAEDALGFGGTLLGLFLYPTVALLMFFAYVLSVLLLVLRWFLVWIVFIGTPLFAVLAYPNWGPLQSVSRYASTFLRMGVFALLAGPIIAIVLRVFAVIMTGGVITGQDGVAGTLHEMGVSLVLVLLLPLVLFVVIWKIIAWAGQPMGVGKAFTTAIAGVAALAGATVAIASGGVGAAAGGAAASGAGRAGSGGGGSGGVNTGGSGGRSGSGSGGGGSRSGSTTATDPSAATDGTSIGSGLRQSIGDALATKRSPSETEQTAASPRNRFGSWTKNTAAAGAARASVLPGAGAVGTVARKTGGGVKSGGALAGRVATGSEVVDWMRGREATARAASETHQENMEFLDTARENGSIDIQEANERDLLKITPAEDVSNVSIEEVTMAENGRTAHVAKYPDPSGVQQKFNITKAHQRQIAGKETADGNVEKWARRTSDVRMYGRAGKRSAKKGGQVGATFVAASGKAGAATMLGGVTEKPYTGYQVGKSIGQRSFIAGTKNMLIGPSSENTMETSESTDPVEMTDTEASSNEVVRSESDAPSHSDVSEDDE